MTTRRTNMETDSIDKRELLKYVFQGGFDET